MNSSEDNKPSSYEIVTQKNTQEQRKKPSNKHTREYQYITYQEALNNSSDSVNKGNNGYYIDEEDEESKKFIKQVEETMSSCISNGTIKSIKLRGRKANSFTVGAILADAKGEFRVSEFFASAFCQESKLKITAVTLLTSPDEERGIRVSLEDNKIRLYEILKGSYIITFNWQGYSVTVNVSDNGTVICSKRSSNLTDEDLKKNEAVKIKIGEGKEMTLYELVSRDMSQDKESSEKIAIISQMLTDFHVQAPLEGLDKAI